MEHNNPNYIWSYDRYLAPYRFILDGTIVEYDIRKANISILYTMKAIDKKTYEYLLEVPKKMREVIVGRMIERDP